MSSKKSKTGASGKKRPDEGAWKRPLFNASEYIYQQGTLTYDNLFLDLYGEAGNPRPLDHGHVQELADALLANPPKEINLTTWENRGVSSFYFFNLHKMVFILLVVVWMN
jgi:hypothetical protein